MKRLAILLAAALAADPVSATQVVVPADPAADAAPAGEAVPAPVRGQPRVSRTRCALVTCEAPCKVEQEPPTPAAATAAPRPAACPARRSTS